MSITSGVRSGVLSGVRSGLNPTLGAVATSDATSGKYVPISAAEYTALGLSTPASIWLMQEAIGDLADSVGSITLTANNSPAYQQSVSGWTRKAVKLTDGTANQNFGSSAAGLPDISTTSALLLLYAEVSTIGSTRGVALLGTTTAELRALTTPSYRMVSGGNLSTGVSNPTGAVRPIVIKVDRTNSACVAYTDQEKLAPTFDAAMTGKQLVVGYTGGTPPTVAYLYGALFTGAAAEKSDAQVKAMLQTLGWTIPWS